MLGVVPAGAQPGDLVVQFWNSRASLVIRPSDSYANIRPCSSIIGRAGVVSEGEIADWDILLDKQLFEVEQDPSNGGKKVNLNFNRQPVYCEQDQFEDRQPIDLEIDLKTLTRLSLDTLDLPQ